jgi:hypothetical protein
MHRWAPDLKIIVSDRSGVGRIEVDNPSYVIRVGETLSPEASFDLGITGPRLTARALAFLTLMALEWDRQSHPSVFARGADAQRHRFASKLGMNPEAFSKFVQRTLRRQPGRIIQWSPSHTWEGRERSRTGGPWWLAIRSVVIEPSEAAGKAFVETVRDNSIDRLRDPRELLRDALATRERGDWVESLGLLDSLADRFRTRQWPRNDPFWFEIQLVRGGTQMQIGARGLWPRVSKNIRVSISEQRLRGPEYDLIAARAHYIAALVYNQAGNGALDLQTIREVRRCKDVLAGRRDPQALDEYWKAASYEEITRARRTGVAAPRVSSAILEAGRVVESQRYQNQMRYGETLLHANRPAAGLEFIQSAIQSGRMELPGHIIGRRLEVMARWMLGERQLTVFEALDEIHKDARGFGFAHQSRMITLSKAHVRQGIRALHGE